MSNKVVDLPIEPRSASGKPLAKSQTFRLSETLDMQIREAAKKSGRTISEEIHWRLEHTFTPNTPFSLRADYEAVSSTYQIIWRWAISSERTTLVLTRSISRCSQTGKPSRRRRRSNAAEEGALR